MKNLKKETNVAPNSTMGHFIKNAKKVYCISEIHETFVVEGESIMTSHNHGTTPIGDYSLTIPQMVVNPLSGMLERSKD